jgi:ELWxxDGT repeat protein
MNNNSGKRTAEDITMKSSAPKLNILNKILIMGTLFLTVLTVGRCEGFSTDDLTEGGFLPGVAIERVTPLSPNSLQVAFNQDMQAAGVSIQDNYSITAPDGSSLEIRTMAVVHGSQNRLVSLATDPQETGALYSIRVVDVFSSQGRATPKGGSSYSFAGYSISQDGPDLHLSRDGISYATEGLLDLGIQNTNETSEPVTLLIENSGNQALEIRETAFQSDSDALSLEFTNPGIVEPGDSVSLIIRTTPPAAGSFGGRLQIFSNDPDEGEYSLNLLATGLDEGAPAVGGDITIDNAAKTSMELSWPAAADNSTEAAELEYLVYYATSDVLKTAASVEELGTEAGSFTANSLSTNVTGLAKNTLYFFTVMVRDKAGNKSLYPSISQKTAGDAELADEINTDDTDPNFDHFYVFSNALYFRANTDDYGNELWSYSTAGGLQGFDINSGTSSSSPQAFTEWNGELYFYANGGDGNGGELWKYDGSNPPEFEYDLRPGNQSSSVNTMAVFQGNLMIGATISGSGFYVMEYDGTTASQISATILHIGGTQTPIFPAGSHLLFSGLDGSTDIYEYDGSNAPTVVTLPSYAYYMYPVIYNSKVYFLETNSGSGSTGKLSEYVPGSGTAVNIATTVSRPEYLAVFGSKLYFSAIESGDKELYSYDGATIELVADIHPTDSSSPRDLTVSGSYLYFSADDGNHGRELWRYDGTNPPEMVMDINEGTDSNPENLTDLNGVLYFSADDGVHGTELWRVKL